MVNFPVKNTVKWWAPLPLWAQNSSTGIRVLEQQLESEPTILRFASDTFMDELLEMLTHSPWRLSDWIAQPETWRQPMPAPRPILIPKTDSKIAHLFNQTKLLTQEQLANTEKKFKKPTDAVISPDPYGSNDEDDLPLKLFQAGHQRYYLVSASLISHEPGYPDCVLDLSRNERTTFVVRRLAPPSEELAAKPFKDWKDSADEYAFVIASGGPQWKKIATRNLMATKSLIGGEEQLPLFPVTYQDQCGHNRRLHSGLIPVGKRETWIGASADARIVEQNSQNPMAADPGSTSLTKIIFQNDVTAPWKALVEQAWFTQDNLQKTASSYFDIDEDDLYLDHERVHRTLRDQIQTGSWYVLLDFARFIEKYLPKVWAVVKNEASVDSLDDDENGERELLEVLQNTRISSSLHDALVRIPHGRYSSADVKDNFLTALAAIEELGSDLESVDKAFVRYDENGNPLAVDQKWPDFLFPLADPQLSAPVPPMAVDNNDFGELSGAELVHAQTLSKIDALADLIEKILPLSPQAEDSMGSQTVFTQGEAWFVVRCVYERPRCGPLFPALVSAPTRAFQMAPFFDPDAPARPVRIPMPLDISPAGLRKYKKNAAFVISDLLCGQIKRIRKLTLGDLVLSVLPWPFHKDLPDPGKSGPCTDSGGSFGMICSLSIPIVTLCALILLMIIVAVFDAFFKWVPYLFVCLPIPGLKGKGK